MSVKEVWLLLSVSMRETWSLCLSVLLKEVWPLYTSRVEASKEGVTSVLASANEGGVASMSQS